MAAVRESDPALEAYAQRKFKAMKDGAASQGRKSVTQPQQ